MLNGGAVAATDCLMKRNPVKGYCSDTQAEMVDCRGELVFKDAPQRLLFFGNLLNACPDASHRHEWRRRYQIMNGICDRLYYLHIVHLDLKPTNILLENCGFWSLEETLNIENKRLELEQMLGVISAPVFLASVNPGDIHNHILHLRNAIHILENSKRALLEEQQELIVAAAAQP